MRNSGLHTVYVIFDGLGILFSIFDVFVFPRDVENRLCARLVVGISMAKVSVPNTMVSLVQVLLHGIELGIRKDICHKKNVTSIHVAICFKSLHICHVFAVGYILGGNKI